MAWDILFNIYMHNVFHKQDLYVPNSPAIVQRMYNVRANENIIETMPIQNQVKLQRKEWL